jgi:hypothetical protein
MQLPWQFAFIAETVSVRQRTFHCPFIQSANNSLKVAGGTLYRIAAGRKLGLSGTIGRLESGLSQSRRSQRSVAGLMQPGELAYKASCREFTNGSSFAFRMLLSRRFQGGLLDFFQVLHRLCQVVDLREQLRFTLVHSLKVPIAPHKGHFELLYVVSSESISGLEPFRRA